MRLITWNVQWCRGVDGKVDPRRIVQHAKMIADFDVICLQEIANNFPDPLLAGSRGENQFEVMVKDAGGKPVTDADVSLLFVMPAMPAMKMPEMRNEVKLTSAGGGTYTGTGQVTMAGTWTVTVSVKQGGKEIGQKKLTLTAK